MTIDDMEKAFLEYQDAKFSVADWMSAAFVLKNLAKEAKAEQARVIRENGSWSELGRISELNRRILNEARKVAEIATNAHGRHVSVTELFDAA